MYIILFLKLSLVLVYHVVIGQPPVLTLHKDICKYPLDLVFILDGSNSVTEVNFKKVKQFTMDLVDEFLLDETNARIGVIEFSTLIGRVIELGQYSDATLLKFFISNIPMSNDGTGTHKALKRMRRMFQEKGRPGIPHIGLVITDGLSVSPYLTKEEANLAHAEGIITFALGIEGDKTFQTELEYIASSKDKALRVSDFDALPLNLSSVLCQIAQPSTSAPRSSTPSSPTLTPERLGDSDGKIDGYVDKNRYFQKHNTDCSKYIEISPGVSGPETLVRACPFGLFWNENALTCVNSSSANCVSDPCKISSPGYSYPMDDLCSGFWTCFDRTSIPTCCVLGSRYEQGRGCVPDNTCLSACPPSENKVVNTVCRKWENKGDSLMYWEEVNGRNISRPCAPGSTFDQTSCKCAHHVSTTETTVPNTGSLDKQAAKCREELFLKFNKGQEGNMNGLKDISGRNLHVAKLNIGFTSMGDGMLVMDGTSSCLNIWRFSNVEYRLYGGVHFLLMEERTRLLCTREENTYLPQVNWQTFLHNVRWYEQGSKTKRAVTEVGSGGMVGSFVIDIKFVAMQVDDPTAPMLSQALMTNCYYKTCTASAAVVIDRFDHMIGVQTETKSMGNYIWWHSKKYVPDVVNNISLKFSQTGTVINFSLNKEMERIVLNEMVLPRQTGMIIGAGGMFANFKGYIDEVKVQQCDGDPPL